MSAASAQSAAAVRGLAAAFAAIAALAVGEAKADVARPELIGFSTDGRYVAYEDYGFQEEAFAYSYIYVIDVAANAWVPGSPIRIRSHEVDWEGSDDEVGLVRDLAMEQARPVLDQYGIVPGEVGTTLVYYPISDVDAPTHEVRFSIHAAFTTYERGLHTLSLSEQEIPHDACDADDLGPVSIMTLALQGPNDDSPVALQTDETLPESRACVSRYRIHSVFVYAPNHPNQVDCCVPGDLAMLVLVETAGWGPEATHGTNYSHLGVTAMVPYAF